MGITSADASKILEARSNGSLRRWTSNSVTYSVVVDGVPPTYWLPFLQDYQTGFGTGTISASIHAPTTAQMNSFVRAAQAWMSVANLQIDAASAGSDGDITIGQVPFGPGSRAFDEGSIATTIPAGVNATNPTDLRYGDIWLRFQHPVNNDSYFAGAGSSGDWTMLHELGHALGLVHSVFSKELQSKSYSDANSWRYSVMSYRDLNGAQFNLQGRTSGVPSAPMLLDIAAIQRLYGANPNTNTTDDTYKFQIDHGWPIQAIWDAGGNDTIDGSDQNRDLHIDLSRGGESYVADKYDRRVNGQPEIHIAFQPLLADGTADPTYDNNFIENAVGGSGNDVIVGNEAANNLNGNDGNDRIFGGAGDDVLVGGHDSGSIKLHDVLAGDVGDDTYVYVQGDGYDEIIDSEGNNVLRIGNSAISTV